jgi:hypothetical protein
MIARFLTRLFGAGGKATPKAEFASDWVEGGLYATPWGEGRYAVLKILKLDEHGVHMRRYSNVYDACPSSLDESSLHVSGIEALVEGVEVREDAPLGVGHMPVSKGTFASSGAVFIQASTVSSEELEGYEMWREAKGGYF